MSEIFRRPEDNFEILLGGSHVAFKKLERPPLSEQENELKLENEKNLKGGIRILRKLRTGALLEEDLIVQQNTLKEAHHFSEQMSDIILNQAISEKPYPIDPSFLERLQVAEDEHAEQDDDSGHGIPPGFSIQNLFRATEDMLARVQERAQSTGTPTHKLTKEEMRYVLQEFLRGTNDLTMNAIDGFFDKDTKVGGILSGGSVYLELVKKIVEKYGDPSLKVDSFVIAVDKENKRAVFEVDKSDKDVKTVIVTDDVIDKGGTLITALWATGEEFPNAIIYSGKGTDEPGGFQKRRTEKHMSYLTGLFQDFAELSEEGKNDEALVIFDQAEKYAKENKVELQAGWHKRRARIKK